jgi:chromosome segregation ATPase
VVQLDDLGARVSALETRVDKLTDRVRHSEQDAAAARVLACGADRDVAELRGEIREFREQNTRVLNAMREDLTDLRQQVNTGFAEMRDFQQQVGAEFAKMRDFQQQVGVGFIEMRGKFDATAAGFQQITGLLNTVLIKRGRRSALIASSVPPTLHRCQPSPTFTAQARTLPKRTTSQTITQRCK